MLDLVGACGEITERAFAPTLRKMHVWVKKGGNHHQSLPKEMSGHAAGVHK